MSAPVRVVVLAPSAVVRAGLEALLGERAGVVVVGGSGGRGVRWGEREDEWDGEAGGGLARATALEPDVVLWALDAPGRARAVREVAALVGGEEQGEGAGEGEGEGSAPGDGVRPGEPVYARSLGGAERGGVGGAAVVLLADASAERGWEEEALLAGAAGVLPADATGEEIAAAVLAAGSGLVVLPREVAGAVLRRVGRRRIQEPVGGVARSAGAADAIGAGSPLSGRERQVLALLAEGLPNKVIAPRLGISEHTVKAHVAAIFEKLGVGTRAEAVVTAARRGLLML